MLAGAQDGIQSTLCAPQVVHYAKDKSFQELEHINKKIETAKYEVEQEQRKLSCYRAAEGQNTNGWWDIRPNSIKAPTQLRKYVLDNSKPRTDLEYDPMSNFTAEFRSYKSSSVALKAKEVHQVDVKKPVSHHVAPYGSPPSEIQDDVCDDDVLIIDIPASPDRKLAQAHCDLDTVGRPVQEVGAIIADHIFFFFRLPTDLQYLHTLIISSNVTGVPPKNCQNAMSGCINHFNLSTREQ